jgi:hypothetical protein
MEMRLLKLMPADRPAMIESAAAQVHQLVGTALARATNSIALRPADDHGGAN